MRQARFPITSSHLWWWNDMLWGLLRLKPAQWLITIYTSKKYWQRSETSAHLRNLARPSTSCAESKDPHFFLCTGKLSGATCISLHPPFLWWVALSVNPMKIDDYKPALIVFFPSLIHAPPEALSASNTPNRSLANFSILRFRSLRDTARLISEPRHAERPNESSERVCQVPLEEYCHDIAGDRSTRPWWALSLRQANKQQTWFCLSTSLFTLSLQ